MKTKSVSTLAGTIAAAILASSCCLGPLILAGLGMGSIGIFSSLEKYRPLFMIITLLSPCLYVLKSIIFNLYLITHIILDYTSSYTYSINYLTIYAYAYIMSLMNIDDLSQSFKCLSEPVRLRVLNLLLAHGELCVCDIVDTLGISQGVVSRHLAYLRNNNILQSRREGTWMYYQIRERGEFFHTIINQLKMNGFNAPEFKKDLVKFSKLKNTCK